MGVEGVIKRINESDPLDFGTIFNDAIALFKKVWLQGFITLILTFVFMLPFLILIYLPMLLAGVTDPEMLKQEEPDAIFIIGMFVLLPIIFVGITGVGLAFNASFLRICKSNDIDEVNKDDYFYFFKKKYLIKLVELSLMILGLVFCGILLCGIGTIYFAVPIALISAFLAFNENLSSIEIVKSSFQLGNKNWLVIIGLLFVMGLIAQLGTCLCYFGVLFTAMLSKVPVYYFYKNSVGFKEKESFLLD